VLLFLAEVLSILFWINLADQVSLVIDRFERLVSAPAFKLVIKWKFLSASRSDLNELNLLYKRQKPFQQTSSTKYNLTMKVTQAQLLWRIIPTLSLLSSFLFIAQAALPQQRTRLQQRNLQITIDEYPIQLEPVHLVYHHHHARKNNFEAMEEMDVLVITRNYLTNILENYALSNTKENRFRRLLLYMFVRQEDESQTKVAYSGTAFFSEPPSIATRRNVQQATWLSFLGTNKTDYLIELRRSNVEQIDSVTLLNVAGDLVGLDSQSGQLVSLASADIDNNTNTSNNNEEFPLVASNPAFTETGPDTSMKSSETMTIYVCAIVVPIVVFLLLVSWWIACKLRHDVNWKRSPNTIGRTWQTAEHHDLHYLEEATTLGMHPDITSITFGGEEENTGGDDSRKTITSQKRRYAQKKKLEAVDDDAITIVGDKQKTRKSKKAVLGKPSQQKQTGMKMPSSSPTPPHPVTSKASETTQKEKEQSTMKVSRQSAKRNKKSLSAAPADSTKGYEQALNQTTELVGSRKAEPETIAPATATISSSSRGTSKKSKTPTRLVEDPLPRLSNSKRKKFKNVTVNRSSDQH